MATSSSPITQVSQHAPPAHSNLQPQLLTRLFLDLRGRRFEVDRETIMNLPESVLLCLFPNGLVLSRQSVALSDGGDDEDDEVYGVDNPLLTKQAIIVLREELEYFTIPPKADPAGTDANGLANEQLLEVKHQGGEHLMDKRNIFTALQRNVNKENNVAEQHLIDMLCMSGFNRDDEWGFRALEPSRSCISSIALVLLKTGITHSPDNSKPVEVDYAQMATAQKLLLFWRKPARKCWWDGLEVDIPEADGRPARSFKLWARRVWTLELSLVRSSFVPPRFKPSSSQLLQV
ncbi:hypothetical protein MKEN_00418900 [Mycena kentingensis (nom. inval.)]|nr:hypothetical protein MKEN_00418900 [Mycena kentingensis (nom. inval.)]